ncbi:MAG: 30S ribosome-binding factor RbfA [Endomicrobiia bacterium]
MKKIPYDRKEKIKKLLHREIAMLLPKLKDPRLSFITITEVEVSNDLKNAKVYYTVMDKNVIQETESMFAVAKGYIKSQVAQRLNLKNAIDIKFVYDKFLDNAQKVLFLLDKIKDETTPENK